MKIVNIIFGILILFSSVIAADNLTEKSLKEKQALYQCLSKEELRSTVLGFKNSSMNEGSLSKYTNKMIFSSTAGKMFRYLNEVFVDKGRCDTTDFSNTYASFLGQVNHNSFAENKEKSRKFIVTSILIESMYEY